MSHFVVELLENAATLVVVVAALYGASRFLSQRIAPGRTQELAAFPYQLATFAWRVRGDHRAPARAWWIVGIAVAYWISPIDLVPGLLPGLALLDDLIVAAVALRVTVATIPETVRREACPESAVLLRRYLGLR